eukprot:scaffold10002_cov58-Phaeocystis_antarctica.AAC.1
MRPPQRPPHRRCGRRMWRPPRCGSPSDTLPLLVWLSFFRHSAHATAVTRSALRAHGLAWRSDEWRLSCTRTAVVSGSPHWGGGGGDGSAARRRALGRIAVCPTAHRARRRRRRLLPSQRARRPVAAQSPPQRAVAAAAAAGSVARPAGAGAAAQEGAA